MLLLIGRKMVYSIYRSIYAKGDQVEFLRPKSVRNRRIIGPVNSDINSGINSSINSV